MSDRTNYEDLRRRILERPLLINRLSPFTTKSPYVFLTYGFRGSGKSCLVDTIFQTMKDSIILENIATSFRRAHRKIEGTQVPVVYTIKQDFLYVMDTPGLPRRMPWPDTVDTKTPKEQLTGHIRNSGSLCEEYGLEGVVPGVAIFVCNALYWKSDEEKLIREALQELAFHAHKNMDIVVALTHWDELGVKDEDEKNAVFARASETLGVDEANIFPIQNYVGTVRNSEHEFARDYKREVSVLRLLYCAMSKMDQSSGKIKRMISNGIVKDPGMQLQITEARYFSKRNPRLGRDVTDVVRAKLSRDGTRIAFKICNDELGGDPVKGQDKFLEVSYIHKHEKHEKVRFKEREYLYLP